jgi:hypothetical protein
MEENTGNYKLRAQSNCVGPEFAAFERFGFSPRIHAPNWP